MNKIEWTRKAAKQILSFPEKIQTAIHKSLSDMLAAWPAARNVKSLTDRDDYRLRVGRYRVFFLILPNGKITVFKIFEVKKRDESTY